MPIVNPIHYMATSEKQLLSELVERIQASMLSEKARNLWYNAIIRAHPIAWEVALFVLKDSPSKLEYVTELLMKKAQAIKVNDQNLWDEILKEERVALNAA